MSKFRGTNSLNELFNASGIRVSTRNTDLGLTIAGQTNSSAPVGLASPTPTISMPEVIGHGSSTNSTSQNNLPPETIVPTTETNSEVATTSFGSFGGGGGGLPMSIEEEPVIPAQMGALDKPMPKKDYFTRKNIIIAILVIITIGLAYKQFKKK